MVITYTDESLTQTPGIISGTSYYVINKNSEKVVLYLQADENGEVYLTNFMAFDYGMFSGGTESVVSTYSIMENNSQLLNQLKAIYGDSTEIQKVYLTKDTDGTVIRQALITTVEKDVPTMKVVNL